MKNDKITIHMIGNAHIDPVWLWKWQEGFAEIKATFQSMLDRMDEYKDFTFSSACASYYKWVEENCPEMFEKIKSKVAEGRWEIVGGWWLQPDCNIPCGESFVRHALYGQRYFLEKFGVTAKTGYNVDSFGHSGMLPQILKKCGMDNYVFMRPNPRENGNLHDIFWWESEDGSRVLTYRIPLSYCMGGGQFMSDCLDKICGMARENNMDMMCFYGVGNHGGGPTKKNIGIIREFREKDRDLEFKFGLVDEYLKNMRESGHDFPVVHNDLQHHACGCYSSVSQIKTNNRKAENRVMSAEKWSTVAWSTMGLKYPAEGIHRAWEGILSNQFHDVMGGCSIQEVYTDASELHGQSLFTAAEALNAALQKISWAIDTEPDFRTSPGKEDDAQVWEVDDRGTPVVIFNPLSWEVESVIEVSNEFEGVTDECLNPVPSQKVRTAYLVGGYSYNTVFPVNIPPLGYRTYWIYKKKIFNIPSDENQEYILKTEGENIVENRWFRMEIDRHSGTIKSLFDKISGVEVLCSKSALPVVVDDYRNDTWAHNNFVFRDEIGTFNDAEVKIIEKGKERTVIRAVSRYNASTVRQSFILYRSTDRIDVDVKVDWREKHKILKLSFKANINSAEATYEIPYGFMERPADGEEEPGQQWVDITGKCIDQAGQETLYGLSIANNGKYSYDIKDNEIRVTVLRSPIFADHYGNRELWDDFEYVDQGIQYFRYSLIPHKDSWKEGRTVQKTYELNNPLIPVIETYHKGSLSPKWQGVKIDKENIVMTVLKKSEDNDDIIVRCYETDGRKTDTKIELNFVKRTIQARFGKCEIKTFRIPADIEQPVKEVDMIEL